MTTRPRFLALLPGLLAIPALPGVASAQRCVVAEVEVPTMEIRVGAREQLIVIFRDRNGLPCEVDPSFTATSNSPAIARVERGTPVYITGVAAGAAVVTVRTAGTARTARTGVGAINVVAEAPVSPPGVAPPPVAPVTPAPTAVMPSGARGPGSATLQYQPEGTAPAAGIVTDPGRMQLLPGESRFLGYHTADVRGGPAERLPLQFAIEPASALSFVRIDSIGVVTALDTGTANIIVTAVGRPNVAALPVPVQVRMDSVTFTRRRLTMAPNAVDTVPMRVPAQDRNIDVRARVFRYESADTAVAVVHLFEPVVESRGPGQTTITATNPRMSPVQLAVNVFRPITAIQLSDSVVTLAIRQTRRVTMRPVADTAYIREAPLTTRGLDTTRVAARYDAATGIYELVGRASGETAITMRVQNGRDSSTAVERTLRIRVVAGGLQLSRTRVGLGVGEHAPIQVALLDEQRRTLAGITPDVTWASSDTAVARFENGQIVARAVGPARLTARTAWDSTATIDLYVVTDMLVVKQQQGAWNLFGRTTAGAWQKLTNDSLVESFPDWSPDLTRIVYAQKPANRPRGGDLMMANADGSNPRRLFTMDSTIVYRPHFVRPAGDVIVFELSYFDGRSEIWSINADGSGQRRRTAGPAGALATHPAVSPDGQRLLYVSQRTGQTGSYDVFVANFADGAGERRLTTYTRTDEAPVWAPDGQSFFFLRDEGEAQRGRPTKRVYRFTIADTTATPVSAVGTFVTAFGVSGDARTMVLNTYEQGVTRLVSLEVATGTVTPVNLDVGELVGQGSPVALRPVAPATAAPAAPSGAAARP